MTAGRFFSLALIAFSAIAAGCRHSSDDTGALSVPSGDNVRLIVGAPAPSTPDHARWTWSVLGERNWTRPTANATQVALADSYPLNDVNKLHGCNTWNCDLTLERDAKRYGQAIWALTLHGSNGMTARSTGVVSVPMGHVSLDGIVDGVQDANAVASLPAQFHLARVAGQEVSLSVGR